MPSATAIAVAILTTVLGHPLEDDFFDRGIQVLVLPDAVLVRYELVVSDKTAQSQLRSLMQEQPIPADRSAMFEQYRESLFPIIGRGLTLTVDGEKRELLPVKSEILGRHHTRLEFTYEAKFASEAAWKHTLELSDGNFPGKTGSRQIALKGREGVDVVESTAGIDLVRVGRVMRANVDEEIWIAAGQLKASCRFGEPSVERKSRSETSEADPSRASQQSALWIAAVVGLLAFVIVVLRVRSRLH